MTADQLIEIATSDRDAMIGFNLVSARENFGSTIVGKPSDYELSGIALKEFQEAMTTAFFDESYVHRLNDTRPRAIADQIVAQVVLLPGIMAKDIDLENVVSNVENYSKEPGACPREIVAKTLGEILSPYLPNLDDSSYLTTSN